MDKELVEQKQIAFEEDEIDLVDLLKTIYKNRKLIIIITLVTTLFGVVFAFVQPKKYKSEMTFVEQKSSSSSSLLSSLSSSIPFGLGSNLPSGDSSSLVTVLESRKFRDNISDKLKLREYILKNSKMDKKTQNKFDKQDVSEWLKDAVMVSQDTKTGIYRINVTLEDKGMGTKIANQYFYVLENYLKNEKIDKSKISRQYLEKQVAVVEKELNEKQEILKAYEEEYKSVDIASDAKVVAESVAKVKGDILKTESELTVARTVYGEESVEIIKLQAKLDELNRQLTNFETGKGSVRFIPLNDIPQIKYELEKLKIEIESTSEVYKMLKVQLEQAKISEINEQSTIELLDEAVIPKMSSSTNPKLIIVISMVLGMFMGAFITFVKEFAKGIDWKEFKN